MVLRLDGRRRPGLVVVDCDGVGACCEVDVCGLSGAEGGAVLMDSMAECRACEDMAGEGERRLGVITYLNGECRRGG